MVEKGTGYVSNLQMIIVVLVGNSLRLLFSENSVVDAADLCLATSLELVELEVDERPVIKECQYF